MSWRQRIPLNNGTNSSRFSAKFILNISLKIFKPTRTDLKIGNQPIRRDPGPRAQTTFHAERRRLAAAETA
jgi:hypothetical protein